MSLADSAARGAAATLVGQGIRFLIQLISLMVLARILTPNEYGVIAMVVAIVGIATVMGDFGLSMAAIQSRSLTGPQRTNLFWINTALGCVLAPAVFLLAGPIAAFYSQPELVAIAQVLSVVFLINALTPQFRAEVSRKLRFKWLAAADVIAQAIAVTIAIGLGVAGFGYWALVAQQIANAAITLIVLVMGAGWMPGLPRKNAGMAPLLSFGANTMGVQLITYVTSNADNVLIGRFVGAAGLGFYDRAFQIFRIPLQQIAAPMTRVALPILSRVQDDPRYDQYVQRAQLILAYGMGGLFVVLIVLADPVVELVLGPDWEAAKNILRVLAVGGVFQALGFVYYWIFLSRNFTVLQLKFSILGRTFMVAAMAVGVLGGPLGVAIGSTVGQIVMWLINTIFAIPLTRVKMRPLIMTAARPLSLFIVLLALTVPVSMVGINGLSPWLQLGVLVPAIVLFFVAAVLLIRPVRRDVVLIWDAVNRVRRR